MDHVISGKGTLLPALTRTSITDDMIMHHDPIGISVIRFRDYRSDDGNPHRPMFEPMIETTTQEEPTGLMIQFKQTPKQTVGVDSRATHSWKILSL